MLAMFIVAKIRVQRTMTNPFLFRTFWNLRRPFDAHDIAVRWLYRKLRAILHPSSEHAKY